MNWEGRGGWGGCVWVFWYRGGVVGIDMFVWACGLYVSCVWIYLLEHIWSKICSRVENRKTPREGCFLWVYYNSTK
jgi:hypothetical protein